MRKQDKQPGQLADDRRRNWAKTFAAAVADKRLSHGSFRLFSFLFTFIDANNQCWPGQRAIRKALGCCADSLKPWTRDLIEAGYISISQRTTTRGMITLYQLHCRPQGDPENRISRAGGDPEKRITLAGKSAVTGGGDPENRPGDPENLGGDPENRIGSYSQGSSPQGSDPQRSIPNKTVRQAGHGTRVSVGAVKTVENFAKANGYAKAEAHRFIYYNNRTGWRINGQPIKFWRKAFLNFAASCDDSVSAVPAGWVPHINRTGKPETASSQPLKGKRAKRSEHPEPKLSKRSEYLPDEQEPVPVPEAPSVSRYSAPTIDRVQAFFALSVKDAAPFASEWFETHGADPRWSSQDWSKAAIRWLMERKEIEKREARKSTASGMTL